MIAAVAERVAVLEAERAIPTPRLTKADPLRPYTAAEQARHCADLLAEIRGTTRSRTPQTRRRNAT